MRFKYIFWALICAAAVFLTGCGDDLTYENGIVDIKNANLTITVPEDWTVGVNDDAYEVICQKVDASAKELKETYEDVGAQILLSARSADETVTVTFIRSDKGDVGAEEQLQRQHDNTVFNFRSLGFYTESSIEEYEWGGVSGWLSVISAYYEEGGTECITEGRQFYFERGDHVFSLVIESVGGGNSDSESIEISSME